MVACIVGLLLEQVNISSQFFIQPTLFDLELEWTVGKEDRERQENETLWLGVHLCISGSEHFWKWAQWKVVYLKTGGTVFQQKQTHAELMTKQFLSGRIEMAERKPPLQLSLRRYLHKEEYLPLDDHVTN